MAPTLVCIDGFEYGINPFITGSTAGGAICTTFAGAASSILCDSTVKRSGGYSLKVIQDGTNITRIAKSVTSTTTLVGAFYFRTTAAPAAASQFIIGTGATPQFRMNTDGTLSALFTSGTAQTTAGTYADSNWHLIDFKMDSSANPLTLDWRVDGAAQTQAVRNIASVALSSVSIGSTGTAANLTFWIDDFVLSNTLTDYPIGSTTTPHSVLAVSPTGDGTHNAGTNTIEDNAGTDIVSPNAFPLLATLPMVTTSYIRQATVDTTAYAEVTFADHSGSIGTIWDAVALMGYTSSTNAANEGACVVSVDGFTTPIEVYGTAAARTNYQSALTTTVNYKVGNLSTSQNVITRPAGGWTTTAFDALKCRVGYSNDVTGNPRWLGIIVQYAGVAGGAAGESDFAGMVPV